MHIRDSTVKNVKNLYTCRELSHDVQPAAWVLYNYLVTQVPV